MADNTSMADSPMGSQASGDTHTVGKETNMGIIPHMGVVPTSEDNIPEKEGMIKSYLSNLYDKIKPEYRI
jgi:hypothetical protein